jgi:hypothetical protein
VRRLRRIPAVVFAGDSRVWRAALLVAVPLVCLLAYYCLRPRDYYTGTNSVEALTYIAEAPAREPVCVPGLQIPAGTARIRLQVISRTTVRPAMTMKLTLAGASTPIDSRLPATAVPATRVSGAVFSIPPAATRAGARGASLCLLAADIVNWGGTPLPAPPSAAPPTLAGHPLAGRVALWYLPAQGSQRSYLARAAEIFSRASLFRPGIVGPWLYVLILLVIVPGLALGSVRCLAQAAGRGAALSHRRMAAALFAIAFVNFACWAFITPAFQAPDELDHFAYTQSLVERGEAPSRDPATPLARWSSSESLALEDASFFTDHQVGNTRVPWSATQQALYRRQVASQRPSSANGGGYETAATHGAIYYATLAPAYMLASSSPFAQLTLMRLTSALIGALAVLFAFLLTRELAPGRPWLAVLAALLVAYEPMYGFISGAVNNDVGVNAGAAALELLMILILRRGPKLALSVLAGGLLIVLPIVKGTAYSLYPVAGVVLIVTLLRHHRRANAIGFAALALSALAVREVAAALKGAFRGSAAGAAVAGPGVGLVASGAIGEARAHPLGYLAYLWEVFLPRLSFMAPHFETASPPAFVIFVERGWGAFGWYDVFFPHWVYLVIFAAMLAVPLLCLVAARREWAYVRRNLAEALIVILIPVAVVAGVEAAFYTPGARPAIAEFGRYAFPAIVPLAVLVVASLHAFGRRWALAAGACLLVAMLALSYAAQLVTLTGFYA